MSHITPPNADRDGLAVSVEHERTKVSLSGGGIAVLAGIAVIGLVVVSLLMAGITKHAIDRSLPPPASVPATSHP